MTRVPTGQGVGDKGKNKGFYPRPNGLPMTEDGCRPYLTARYDIQPTTAAPADLECEYG